MWFGGFIPESIGKALHPRKTQIFPFEVIAIWAAIMAFKPHLTNRHVLFFVDNQSALASSAKGTTTASDVQEIISSMWDFIQHSGIHAAFRYVPSKLNLADPPSRGKAPIVGTQVPLRLRWELLLKLLPERPSRSSQPPR